MNNVAGASAPNVGAAMAGGLIVLAIVLGMYVLPTIVALARKHRQTAPIALLNILLGWSVLGWIGAMIWALTTPQQPQTIIVQQAAPPGPPAA